MKTLGQRLYEYKSPPMLDVVQTNRLPFVSASDVFAVPNQHHTPWKFLTAECQASWERSAVGHHIFSGGAA